MPIPKKGENPRLSGSYWPIFVLSTFAKMLEQTIKTIIDEDCDSNNSIPDFQLLNRTDEHALLILKTYVLRINGKTPTIVGLLNIRKAFGVVWQYGLVYKLENILNFHSVC